MDIAALLGPTEAFYLYQTKLPNAKQKLLPMTTSMLLLLALMLMLFLILMLILMIMMT